VRLNRRQLNLWGIPRVEETIVPAMPYMGSKRKLANKILNAIYQTIGDFDTLYDLFGGGGAMSVAALRAGHEVFYNEKNQAIVELLKYIQKGEKLPNKWVAREEYKEKISGNDWFAGFLLCCWSFGQKYGSYLFGADVERLKQLAHNVVVDRDIVALQELNELLNCKLTMPCNRFDFKEQIRASTVDRFDLQQLERLQQLESLNISYGDYDKIEINGNAAIYCDPPYSGTEEYKDGAFDSIAFWQWCREQKSPIFISEYAAPDDFAVVAEFEHRSTLSSTNNAKVTIEKLFWNGVKQ
jgi:site-specific DNA-adenine methylase